MDADRADTPFEFVVETAAGRKESSAAVIHASVGLDEHNARSLLSHCCVDHKIHAVRPPGMCT